MSSGGGFGERIGPPVMSLARAPERVLPDALLDRSLALLGAVFLLAAYIDAWDRSRPPGVPGQLGPWDEAGVTAGWLCITALLIYTLLRSLQRGVPFGRALPNGYDLSLAGCLVFGAAAAVDGTISRGLGFGSGIEALVTPTHLFELIGGGLMVSGPLRAAMRRRDEAAGLPAIVSAALLLSTLTFFTQFANPLVDVWPARGAGEPNVLWWVAQDLGAAGLLIQGCLLVAIMLLLVRRFTLPPGSLTLVCLLNGILVVILKARWELLPVPLLTGLSADLMLHWLRPSAEKTRGLRIFTFGVGSLFSLFYFGDVVLAYGGTWWSPALCLGLIVSTGVIGFLVSYVAGVRRARPLVGEGDELDLAQVWPRHGEVSPVDVKTALESLNDPPLLAGNPLVRLACISGEGTAGGQELRTLLIDVCKELAAARSPRDAEAGALLVDYYVRRVGSHEVIAERLHLSRPTFYRRLQLGLSLVAARVDELAEFAARHGG